MKTALIYLRIAVFGVISWISGALCIDWLGTSWWSRALASLTVLLTMAYVLVNNPYGLEVPNGKA